MNEQLPLNASAVSDSSNHRSVQQLMNPTYAEFRFRAVVDWIELRIVTTSPSNFDTVKKRMGLPYVTPLNKGAGGAATEFSFRIQDPTSWASVHDALARFTVDHPLAEPVTVTGIEIALDAYSRYRSKDDLVELAARFYKFATKVVSGNRRCSKEKHTTQGVSSYTGLKRRLADDFNIYIGNRADSVKQHIYIKQTNIVDGVVVKLPTSEHRARTEFTITNDNLPHASLADWQNHDFTTHAEFFRYRKLKTDLPPMVSSAVEVIDQIGERRERLRKCRGTRLFSKSTVADTKLNNLAYSALRELSIRMKS